MDWKKIKSIDWAGISGKSFSFMLSKMHWFFLGMAIILTAFCCYLWYVYIYNPDWSEERKRSYIQTKESNIGFNREKFEKFIRGTDDRQLEFQKDLPITSDIFRLKK